MMSRQPAIDRQQFGPWALVTGASSGIGTQFARILAANGLNVVLAARRVSILDKLGRELTEDHGVEHRTIAVDLSAPDFLAVITAAVADLDLGLVVSNAGDMNLGEFLTSPYDALLAELRLNAECHLSLTHHFGQKMVARRRGGVLLVSSLAGIQGVPYIANYSAAKSYVLGLGEAVHRELAPHGVHVTVLVPGATATPMTARFSAGQTAMGRLMMPAAACAADGLRALVANRPVRISGRMNRVTAALTPRAVRIRAFGAMNRSMAVRLGLAAGPAVAGSG
jgi:uncharacterized protein